MMPSMVISGISFGFPKLSRCEGQIAHVLLTRSPLVYSRRSLTARLACVKHAASVRPEPGSNSPLKSVDSRPSEDGPLISSLEYPGKRCSLAVSQGDFLPKEPSTGGAGQLSLNRNSPVDGALLIRSSTFGTLLSSQGSGAHRHPTSQSGSGQLVQLTRLRGASQITAATRFGLGPPPDPAAKPRCGGPSQALAGRPPDPLCWEGSCVSSRSGEVKARLRRRRATVKSLPTAQLTAHSAWSVAGQSPVSASQGKRQHPTRLSPPSRRRRLVCPYATAAIPPAARPSSTGRPPDPRYARCSRTHRHRRRYDGLLPCCRPGR